MWGIGYIFECMGGNQRTACESWNSPSTVNLLSLLDDPGSFIVGNQLRMFVRKIGIFECSCIFYEIRMNLIITYKNLPSKLKCFLAVKHAQN